jgi:hypothetical protein
MVYMHALNNSEGSGVRSTGPRGQLSLAGPTGRPDLGWLAFPFK